MPSPALSFATSLLVFVPVAHAGADPAHGFKLPLPPQGIYGGTEVEPCGWPTTVSMQGNCTGTLVHPEVVIYAAHCGSSFGSVQLGENINGGVARSVPTEFCRTYPGGGTNGTDFAFCKLSEPQDDVPIVPPLMGCETSILQVGQEVVVVGFGNADNGPYGIKREVTTQVSTSCAGGGTAQEICVGGGGKDSCQGDSGGPVYVKLPVESGVGSWRVFGITSWGGACGSGGWYSQMYNGMEWFESESGIDLTPCHDADGTWNPGPDCFGFPMDPASGSGNWSTGCGGGPMGAYESVCGAPFNSEPDETAPIVAIALPTDGQVFMSDPGTGQAPVDVHAMVDDGDGWGVQSVQLVINGQDVPNGESFAAPYEWSANFPSGIYEVSARATDYAGNVGTAPVVTFGVDMEPPPPDPSTSGTGSGGTDGGGTDSGDTDSDGPATSGGSGLGSGTSGASQDDGSGCGCSARSPFDHGGLGLFALLGLLAVRRRSLH